MKSQFNFRIYRRRGILYLYSYHIVTFSKFYISTGMKCPDRYWDEKEHAIKNNGPTARKLIVDLEKFISEAHRGIQELEEKGLTINTRNLKKVLVGELEGSFMNDYKTAILEAPVKESTRAKKMATYQRLEEYGRHVKKEVTHSLFNKDNYLEFYNWLFDHCKLTDSTVRKHIKELRWFLKLKRSRMDIKHVDYPPVSTSSYFLNEEELKLLVSADLEGRRAVWRDYLVLMCYTGMRISDAVRLNPSWIDIEQKLIRYEQLKTNSEAYAPLTNVVLEIVHKRNATMPRISGQKLNAGLKKLLAELEINRVIEWVKTRRGYRDTQYVPICTIASSHLGRRTFINRCIRKGVPLDLIAKMTGHKDIRILEHYKKIYAHEVSSLTDLLN